MERERWLAKRASELLPIPYFHGVFTLPHEYNALVPYNEALIYSLIMRTAASVLNKRARRELGGDLGILAVLHTWNQKQLRHIHAHLIVTGGALSRDESIWTPTKSPKWLFDVKEIMVDFRMAITRRIKRAHRDGKLKLPPDCKHLSSVKAFREFADDIAAKKWQVYVKPPFSGPEKVLQYLARYTHRVAISNSRILSAEDGRVVFAYRDNKDNGKKKELDLPATEFIKRFLMHILPKGFTKVRYYGFLASNVRKERLTKARTALSVDEPEQAESKETYKTILTRLTELDLNRCPVCGSTDMRLDVVWPLPYPHTVEITGRSPPHAENIAA